MIRRLSKRILATVLLVVFMLSFSIVAFAANNDISQTALEYFNAHEADFDEYLTDDVNDTDDANYMITTSAGDRYVKKGELTTFKSKLNNAASSDVAKKEMNNAFNNGIHADLNAGTEFISGFEGTINLVLGIVVVAISVGLAIFTAFDVCYIVFPVFRANYDEKNPQGQKKSGMSLVSDEARYAVSQSMFAGQGGPGGQGGNNSNPLITYFKGRLLTYIVVAIILFILLTGNISIITSLALKLVSGIMSVIQNLAS